MLEKIRLKNFQIHEELEVDFDQFVTSIIGRSSVGKSSLIRALLWLSTNKSPRGRFLSFSQDIRGVVSVYVSADGGTLVGRIKGGKRNLYKYNSQKYSAVKKSVPEDIAKFLNIDRSNFSLQLDSPLWFTLSPGQVSKELNSIINLSEIDKTLFNASSELRSSKLEAKLIESRLKEAKSKRDELIWVLDAKKDFEGLNKKQGLIKEIKSKLSQVKDITQEGVNLTSTLQITRQRVLNGFKVVSLGSKLLQTTQRLNTLTSLIDKASEAKKLLSHAPPDLSVLRLLCSKYTNTSQRLSTLCQITTQIQNTQSELAELELSLLKRKKLLKQTLGDSCPLCGAKMS